jgi:hypothetical protein
MLIVAFQRRRRFDTWTACGCLARVGAVRFMVGWSRPHVNEFSSHICALCATQGTAISHVLAKRTWKHIYKMCNFYSMTELGALSHLLDQPSADDASDPDRR